jgi:hypothetical protein
LAEIVDLVAWPDSDCVFVANADGAVRLRVGVEPELLWGRNPVADQNPLAFIPYDAELADASPPNARNAYPLADLVTPAATYVVGLLWDGVNAGDLLSLTTAGQLPGLARLLDRGCALRGGAIAEFPSVTLTNHTSALIGLGTGRHGVVGNVYYDVDTGEVVVANDATAWHRSAEWCRPGVQTVFEIVGRTGTACVNEPVDQGAEYSTMALIRSALIRAAGSLAGADALAHALPDPRRSRFATVSFADTVVLMTADHGSEAADPQCRGGWNGALREAGLGSMALREERGGFLYFSLF